MTKYLIIYNGVVRDIFVKDKPLVASDIIGYFDHVVVDVSNMYKAGDKFDLEQFAARNVTSAKLTLNKIVDVERYRR